MSGVDPVDVLVVGGGPVGLHAALKAAVLNHTVLLVDKGRAFSRISQAAAVASVPGSPGISGLELLERGRAALREFRHLAGKDLATLLEDTEAVRARRDGDLFVVTTRGPDGRERDLVGRTLVLATGVVDRKPGISEFERVGHRTLAPWVGRGAVGYCILCEGWSVDDRRVAVIGSTAEAATLAQDLKRHFGADVVLLTDGAPAPATDVPVDARRVETLAGVEGALDVVLEGGARERFDKAFFSLGWWKVNNELAVELGAAIDHHGYVVADDNSEVTGRDGRKIRGLFAVGDLRAGRWKQVVVGWGDAETAVITAYAHRLPD